MGTGTYLEPKGNRYGQSLRYGQGMDRYVPIEKTGVFLVVHTCPYLLRDLYSACAYACAYSLQKGMDGVDGVDILEITDVFCPYPYERCGH
jgi:hypothetical protein